MCAIIGIIDYAGLYSTAELERLVQTLRDSMTHRGPDDAGLWTSPDGRVVLGQRRLSIIDLRPEGRQPMLNEDGGVAVTFNGEIYNFADLRRDLSSQGHVFRSRTDTEVLCHLFEGDPFAAVEQLSGMFAFGVWRHEQRELILARDHFGKKPLYYIQRGSFLAFASELSALEPLAQMRGGIDPVAIQEYILLQYIPAPRTIYEHVRKLEPGMCQSWQFSKSAPPVEKSHRFFQFDAQETWGDTLRGRFTPGKIIDACETAITAAVSDRMVADVPVGAFLSGGNDSSLVVALMAKKLGKKVQTFSIGFANSPSSEHRAAAEIAQHLGTDHHELIVDPSAVEMLPTIVAALDEPNGDSSCLPVYLLSQFARQHVTVALSGDGGDEMFGGYGRYTFTELESARSQRRQYRRQHGVDWSVSGAYVGPRVMTMAPATLAQMAGGLLPKTVEFIDLMNRWADAPGPAIHRVRSLDAWSYLPGAVLAKVDRMSMQFALEVRSPLLDRRVAEISRHLPAALCNDGVTPKKILKALCRKYLPESIVNRPKQGFGIPDQCWSQVRLMSLAEDLLLAKESRLTNFLDIDRLRDHLRRQHDPNHFHVYQIWELIVLEAWLRRAAERAGASTKRAA